jgi:hypothetical protein
MKGMRSQDVQYITCDHNCVVRAGFTSERVRRVCKAVKKDVTSTGDVGGGLSGKRECKGADCKPRARLNVCLNEENPRDVDDDRPDCWKEGECARGGLQVVDELPSRRGDEGGAGGPVLVGFFLPLNGRRNDHSDSNCTDSISEGAAEWSSKAASRN